MRGERQTSNGEGCVLMFGSREAERGRSKGG